MNNQKPNQKRTSFLRMDVAIEVSRRELNQSISLVDQILLEVEDDCARAKGDLRKLRTKLSGMLPQRSLSLN